MSEKEIPEGAVASPKKKIARRKAADSDHQKVVADLRSRLRGLEQDLEVFESANIGLRAENVTLRAEVKKLAEELDRGAERGFAVRHFLRMQHEQLQILGTIFHTVEIEHPMGAKARERRAAGGNSCVAREVSDE